MAMAMSNLARPVYFDLETSGLGENAEIIQIGAFEPYENRSFTRYVLPEKNIPNKTTEHNGFELIEGELYQNGIWYATTDLKTALIEFVDFLEELDTPITLVGHNILNFDCRFLFKAFKSCSLKSQLLKSQFSLFASSVEGFSDSLPLFRQYLPHLASHKLGYIHESIVGSHFTQHNALEDCIALYEIFECAQLEDKITEYTESFAITLQKYNDRTEAKQRYMTMVELLDYGVSIKMVWKMAYAGITLDIISNIWWSEGMEGLEAYLSEPMADGKPRVTSDCNALCDICHAVLQVL